MKVPTRVRRSILTVEDRLPRRLIPLWPRTAIQRVLCWIDQHEPVYSSITYCAWCKCTIDNAPHESNDVDLLDPPEEEEEEEEEE